MAVTTVCESMDWVGSMGERHDLYPAPDTLPPTRWPVPRRTSRTELLDMPISDETALAANLADIRAVNRWLGGTASVVRAVASLCRGTPHPHETPLTLLDVATGSGDIPLALQEWACHHAVPLRVLASDKMSGVLREAHRHTSGRVSLLQHDALRLPFADRTIDVVTCAQALHHFDPPAAIALLRELARVARRGVVVSDLCRSWPAYIGAHLLGLVQRSSLSRHDGPLSVLRAYTPAEIRWLLDRANLRAHRVSVSGGPVRVVLTVQG